MSETPDKRMKEFLEWWAANYPDQTWISVSAWHGPKIYRAATRQLEKELAAAQERAEKAESELAEWRKEPK